MRPVLMTTFNAIIKNTDYAIIIALFPSISSVKNVII